MAHQQESAEAAAARLAAIVDSSDDAIVGRTLEGVINFWNRGAEKLFGYTADEAIGQHIRLIIPEPRHGEDDEVLERIRHGQKVDHFETVRRARDGRMLDISLSVSPILDRSGAVIGISKIARDISDQKRIERERSYLLAEAQQDIRAKDDFLALLGHELRNPLAAISSASHVLSLARSLEDVTRPQLVIDRQVAHLMRLVDDLLDAARIRVGKVALDIRAVALADAVEHVVDVLRAGGFLDRHNLEIHVDKVAARADPVRLEQIITNLLTNALKYTPVGRRITIIGKAEGNKAVLRVEDEGVGIAPEALSRIFGLFVQGEWTSDRARGGLGIGLTLVRSLAELHKGTVEVASDGPGCGAVFTLRLPIAERADSPAAKLGLNSGIPQRRVLIVEDNADAREMLRILLERLGHEVFEAGDGTSGLELALKLRPELAFVDIGLPGLDGYEVARRIRRAGHQGRLVALTGYGQPEDRQRSLVAGFDDHVAKPVTPDRLRAALAKAS